MLSRNSVDILLDLLEIKLAAFIVQDREDPRELERLRMCKRELLDLVRDTRRIRREQMLQSNI
jgi:hypothetical protein